MIPLAQGMKLTSKLGAHHFGVAFGRSIEVLAVDGDTFSIKALGEVVRFLQSSSTRDLKPNEFFASALGSEHQTKRVLFAVARGK